METWKKILIGVVVAVIIWKSPAGSGDFLHQAWEKLWTFIGHI